MSAVRKIGLTVLALFLSAAAVLTTATPAHADDDTYAAIAYAPSGGYYGYSYGYSSRSAAEAEALAQCKGDDAKVVVWGRNAHVALAVGEDGSYGSAWGSTQAIAERIATQQCRDYGASRPRIVVSVYSGD